MNVDHCAGWKEKDHDTDLPMFVAVFSGYEMGEDEAERLCSNCLTDLMNSNMWHERVGMITVYDVGFKTVVYSNRKDDK